jgi:hypothetical protein
VVLTLNIVVYVGLFFKTIQPNYTYIDHLHILFIIRDLSVLVIILQAQELRKYFKSLGAEISEEKSPKGIEDDLHKIVGVCDVCFKEPNESDIEAILNSIVSIMVSVSSVSYSLDTTL